MSIRITPPVRPATIGPADIALPPTAPIDLTDVVNEQLAADPMPLPVSSQSRAFGVLPESYRSH
ncbi:hypothetical protein [Mycetocola miduiensis]|uniref:Uncharacterized protein n=1 Tax=Mycetocola miduiensis TaxID=995034 RepID=A0A1I4ZXD4_9MICO|nr:hypothetical protein [Mycetocola miduiensis]SFN54729.1 hypothetical protein SAMN05216219_1150 [Mycetocola miduiensis]